MIKARKQAEAITAELLEDGRTVPSLAMMLVLGPSFDEGLGTVSGLPMIALDAVRRFREDDWGDSANPAWVLLTEAMAWLLGQSRPDAARVLAQGRDLARAPSWVLDRWDERCVATIRALTEDVRDRWLDVLGTMPIVAGQINDDTVGVRVTPIRASWELAHPFEIWDDRQNVVCDLEEFAPIRILKRMDRSRWFQAVDSWSDPRLIQGALNAGLIPGDLAYLSTLVRIAAPCFDEAGLLTGRSCAIVLCGAALRAAETLGRTERVDDAELRHAVKEFVDSLLERIDGARIGSAFAAHLTELSLLRDSSHRDIRAATIMVSAVSDSFCSRGVPLAKHRELLRERASVLGPNEAQARTRRYPIAPPWQRELPAFLSAARSATSPTDMATSKEWIRVILTLPDEWRWVSNYDAVIAELCRIVAREGDAAMVCRTLFEELEQDRRREEFSYTRMLDRDGELPSLIILAVLMQLVNANIARNPDEVLEYVVERTYRIELTQVSRHGRPRIDPLRVIAGCLQVARDQFGVTDHRTTALLARIRDNLHAVGTVLVSMADQNLKDTDAMLNTVGLKTAHVRDDVRRWAEATGNTAYTDLAEAFERLRLEPDC